MYKSYIKDKSGNRLFLSLFIVSMCLRLSLKLARNSVKSNTRPWRRRTVPSETAGARARSRGYRIARAIFFRREKSIRARLLSHIAALIALLTLIRTVRATFVCIPPPPREGYIDRRGRRESAPRPRLFADWIGTSLTASQTMYPGCQKLDAPRARGASLPSIYGLIDCRTLSLARAIRDM